MVAQRKSPFERMLGLPSLGEFKEVLSGPMGRQLNTLLGRLEKISQDQEGLSETRRLLEYCQQLNRDGTLDKVEAILGKLPQGVTGKNTIIELRKLLDDLATKLEKFSSIISLLDKEEDGE